MSIPSLACMAAAAAFYHLPPRVLPAIQAVEGGRPGLIQPNANGTGDPDGVVPPPPPAADSRPRQDG